MSSLAQLPCTDVRSGIACAKQQANMRRNFVLCELAVNFNKHACDRALSYNLSASERQEVLALRKSVIERGVIRVNR